MADDGTKFRELLVELVREFGGTKQDFAAAAGITPSSLSHLCAGSAVPSIEVVLRIANASGSNASRLLRAAGRGVVAAQLENLYGPAAARRVDDRRHHYSAVELRHIDTIRQVPDRARRAIFIIVDAAAAAEQVKRQQERDAATWFPKSPRVNRRA